MAAQLSPEDGVDDVQHCKTCTDAPPSTPPENTHVTGFRGCKSERCGARQKARKKVVFGCPGFHMIS